MVKKRMPKSIRKFIRKEKARIRREVLDIKEQEKLIAGVYKRFSKEKKPVVVKAKKGKKNDN